MKHSFRLILLVLALLLMLTSWVQVRQARSGLVLRRLTREGIPMLYLAPQAVNDVPGVLIAHGFGGSKQLMLTYGHVLARAGYAVLLWDFDGHAANSAPLNMEGDALQQNLEAAYQELIAQPEVDATQVALLGHSMGSGAVMTAGINNVARYHAVVAVSPTGAEVTSTAPRNLLLQAGALEPQFAANARTLLAAAGGENEDMAGGRGRAFTRIPGVEHITILFSPDSHQAALTWLNRTFGHTTTSTYHDNRILWYAIHFLAGTVALVIGVPMVVDRRGKAREPETTQGNPTLSHHTYTLFSFLPGLIAPFLASGLLFLLSLLGDLSRLGGVIVGGALGVWLFLMGAVMSIGFRPTRPQRRALLWGMVLFVLLWFIVGALAQVVWLPWWLIPARLVRWPVLALLCLPWTVAAAHGQAGQRWPVRLGWWLAQSLLLITGILLAIALIPGLFVLVLILPLFPLFIGLMTITNATIADPWAGGLANALFFAWLLLAYFPLSGF
ncbi:MAG: alpha/beta fold hydrolase [Candidatus Promineifilaceae bacterium]